MAKETQEEGGPDLSGLALIALDIQEPFVRSLSDGPRFVNRCAFAVEAAVALNIPVIYTEQVPEKLGPVLDRFRAAAPGSTVFPKTRFSCFGAEGFEAHLKENDIHHLIIIGLETPICVYQSVIEAMDNGFEVTLLSDCVGARRTEDAEAALRSLAHTDTHILPAETVVYSILSDATHPAFRKITSLVKKYGEAS